jgi:hypothetical protein
MPANFKNLMQWLSACKTSQEDIDWLVSLGEGVYTSSNQPRINQIFNEAMSRAIRSPERHDLLALAVSK